MKFVIAKQDLSQLIGKLQNIVPQKSPAVPILTNFHIEAKSGLLTLTATDLTVGLRCCVPAKVLEEGGTTLPAKHLFQLVRELTAANVEISSTDSELSTLVSGSSRFKIKGRSKGEYPALPDLAGSTQIKIKEGVLKSLLSSTSFAVSREDNRYMLTGVLLKVLEGQAIFVGTDGKRLARAAIAVEIDPSMEGEYIIPIKAVDEVSKNLTDDEEKEVTLSLMKDKIAFESESVSIITKLLAGEYPDVERIIPAPSDLSISLHREELISLLRQISLFTADSSHSVRFTFVDGELILSGNRIEIGEGKASMPVNYSGERLDIALNPNFFLDILRHCKAESVVLELVDSYNPGKILDPSNPNVQFVIMPMRLNEDG